MVEAEVRQNYGVVAVSSFLFLAIVMLRCSAPWADVLVESGRLESPEQD